MPTIKAEQIFNKRYLVLAQKTDRLFGGLLVFQWLMGIGFALTLSPKTWSGDVARMHIHVPMAIFLGALVGAPPVYMAFAHPGRPINRMVIAVSQILFSVLLIHLTGGRIETHFHIFGSLAFLAFYRDWRPLLIGTAVTAADHLLRGALWPESVYGVLSASPLRAFEHAAWVLFEDFILLFSIKIALGELKEVAEREAEIQNLNQTLEQKVQTRTQELLEKNEELAQSQQIIANTSKMSALGEMAGGVAHEINSPLAAIRNLSSQMQEVLSDDPLDKPLLREMAADVEETTERIAKIVSGLRSFARDGSRDPSQKVSVHSVIDETLSFCRERFKMAGVRLTVDDFAQDVRFEGRATQISQVLLNLLNNAHDAISGRQEKWIRLSVVDSPDWVEMRVTDSGNGIPPEVSKKLFQPFFTTKEIGKGTGLGLSISSGIVQSHKGTLAVDPQSPHTCFVIRLPKQ